MLYAVFALWSFIALLRWGFPALMLAARQRRRWLNYLALAALAVVLSQGSEVIAKAGLVAADHVGAFLIAEEFLESLFTLHLCQALFLAWRTAPTASARPVSPKRG